MNAGDTYVDSVVIEYIVSVMSCCLWDGGCTLNRSLPCGPYLQQPEGNKKISKDKNNSIQ